MANELYHYGIKGMKWGVRRARKSNKKVDKSFNDWDKNTKLRDNAISLGKKRNASKIAYETNKSRQTKSQYKQDNKAYKKALSLNTTYRKGVVRQEVGRDASRKYLSASKKVKKQLDADPNNRNLKKQYKYLDDRHEVERANARRAKEVGEKRSRRKASIKRTMTMTTKAAITGTAITAGAYAVNRYMNNHNISINGQRVKLDKATISNVADLANKAKRFMGYMY